MNFFCIKRCLFNTRKFCNRPNRCIQKKDIKHHTKVELIADYVQCIFNNDHYKANERAVYCEYLGKGNCAMFIEECIRVIYKISNINLLEPNLDRLRINKLLFIDSEYALYALEKGDIIFLCNLTYTPELKDHPSFLEDVLVEINPLKQAASIEPNSLKKLFNHVMLCLKGNSSLNTLFGGMNHQHPFSYGVYKFSEMFIFNNDRTVSYIGYPNEKYYMLSGRINLR